ncbi:MAG TPA: Plug domain-containing protein [Puia sp.]|nr:Plug domain-containing protein [Puia sp.]
MNTFKKILSGFIIFLYLNSSGQNEQKGGIDALAGQFIKYIRTTDKEKIIVLTDKMFYASGENIWLKAWCLNSLSNKIVHKSKNLFIDLVDDKDSLISQLLFNIGDLKTDGRISLPESLKEGYYWLRGYTNNMLKADVNSIFVKPVYILNGSKSDPRSLSAQVDKTNDPADTSAPQVRFFPEGGSIISGTTANVAFLCSNANGKPMEISGYIIDSRYDTVTRFATSLPGRGKFSFDAFSPRKYFAHIKWKNKELTYPLPRINQFSSQLSLVDQNDQTFHMRVSLGDSLYKKNKTTYILGISRDSLCFAANGTDMYDINIPKNSFPNGLATLFLFDEGNQIVSQRNIYNNFPGDSNRIAAVTDKPVYEPREKVKLNISIPPVDHQSMMGLFTVSVTDARFGSDLPDLTGDDWKLFDVENGRRHKQFSTEEIDLIMLTQKNLYSEWRYDDHDMSMRSASDQDETGLLYIKGKIVNKKNEPLKSYIVNLFSGDKRVFTIDTTDGNGHFVIQVPDYYDGTQFNLKLTNLKGQGEEGKVILDKPDFPRFNTPPELKRKFDQSAITVIRNFKIHSLEDTSFYTKENALAPVTIKGQKDNTVNYDASKRVNQFSYIITSDNLNNGDPNVLANAIKNIPGFNTGVNTMSTAMVSVQGVAEPTIVSSGVQPLIVMDGVPLSLSGDVNTFLQSVDPRTIDFVEVLKGPESAMYGMQGAGGVILINTTNIRKQVSQINSQGFSTIYPKGYFKQTEFTFPDYDKKEVKKSSAPDKRTTLYWNANLLTDKTGNAAPYFFNADGRAVYAITIMGITENGNLIGKRITFNGQ